MTGLRALLVAAVLAYAPEMADAGTPTGPPPPSGPDPIDQVRSRLLLAERVVVGSACGSAVAPWAYRGRRGTRTTLRAYARSEPERSWNEKFVAALLEASDWDSSYKFRGLGKPCDETHAVPLFTVTWQGRGGDAYALLSFEARGTVLFEADRPMGMVRMGGRADSLFDMIRRAMPEDSLLQAMVTPAATPASLDESIHIRDAVSVGQLPEVTKKVKPLYPEEARRAEIEGTVFVQALVGTDGSVQDAFVERRSGLGVLEEPAVDVVWDWKFKPARDRSGTAVSVWVAVPVKFSLR